MSLTKPSPRFSGHETFVCRFTWLPKVVRELARGPELFSNEDNAMVRLGVGKNMVRSAKFWADCSSITEEISGGWGVTDFGATILGHDGYDQYLQQIRFQLLL